MRFLSAPCIGFLLICSNLAFGQHPGDAVFAGIQVHTVNLRFPQADYWQRLQFYYDQGDEQYIPAQAVIDNVTYDSIGVRLKGNSSYLHPNNKKSFRLAFDEYVDSLRWDELKSVHINNMWGDPSFMREKIHLDFCRDAGIVAPRANYVRLLINDTLFAFYSLVEHVDKTFLDTRFTNKSGDLFKAVDGLGPTGSLISDFVWYGSDTARYLTRYEMKTEGSLSAWPQLIGFIDTLTNSPNAADVLQRKTAFPQFCASMAADNLFGNLDSYLNSGRNFYVYFHGKTGSMHWIVWDAGLSFGAYTGGVSSPERMSVTYVISTAQRPLLAKIFSTPELKQHYLQTLCALSTEYFRTEKLFPHIDSVAVAIRPCVAEDARKMYTMQQFETNITTEINATGGGGLRKPGLKSFLTQRGAEVKAQLAALGISCALDVEPEQSQPEPQLTLAQNYPNPFNPTTTIAYSLPTAGHTTLSVYNALGKVVATLVDREESPGAHSIQFDSGALPSGLYSYTLAHGRQRITRTLALVR